MVLTVNLSCMVLVFWVWNGTIWLNCVMNCLKITFPPWMSCYFKMFELKSWRNGISTLRTEFEVPFVSKTLCFMNFWMSNKFLTLLLLCSPSEKHFLYNFFLGLLLTQSFSFLTTLLSVSVLASGLNSQPSQLCYELCFL